MYKALHDVPFDKVRVVILGQDPYHNPGSATGRAFETGTSYRNPSLRNIENSLGSKINFDLWCEEGVLLLNTSLTVEKGKPGSHLKIWKPFTEEIITKLSQERDDIIWVMWGAKALQYKDLILNPTHNFVISSHPSPFSYNKRMKSYPAFQDLNSFEQVNKLLSVKSKDPIKWTI